MGKSVTWSPPAPLGSRNSETPSAPAPGRALQDHLYVVDPQGNWMMRFPPGLDAAAAAKAKRDLERLMRASASWDEAGRTDAVAPAVAAASAMASVPAAPASTPASVPASGAK